MLSNDLILITRLVFLACVRRSEESTRKILCGKRTKLCDSVSVKFMLFVSLGLFECVGFSDCFPDQRILAEEGIWHGKRDEEKEEEEEGERKEDRQT